MFARLECDVDGLGSGSSGIAGAPRLKLILDMLGRRCCGSCSCTLGFRRDPSKGPLFMLSNLCIIFPPLLLIGLFGSKLIHGFLSGSMLSCREAAREGALSLPFGVFRPSLVPGLLPLPVLLGRGKAGNAQSRFEDNSGLGGRMFRIRGIGLVMLRSAGGLLPLLLPDCTLTAGDRGESDRGGLGARKGLFAASGLIFGGAVLEGFGAGLWAEVTVGARIRV